MSYSIVPIVNLNSILFCLDWVSAAAVLLDLEENDFTVVAEKIVNELLRKGEIRASDQETLLKTLLEKRR